MQPRHHVSSTAVELIKRFEGFRGDAAQLPDGRWTVGYGHTRFAREGARIDEDDAGALLLFDLGEVSVVLNELIFTPLTQNQFDALVSFAMNIGVEEFRRSAVLLRINEGELLQAAGAIELWRKADFEGERIVVDALIRRRAAEKALFLTPTDGFVPTPTPVVRPRFDHGAPILAAPAVELTAPLEGDDAAARREAAEEPAAPAQTPTQAAAANVSARLQSILDDLDLSDVVAVEPEEQPAQPDHAEIVAPARSEPPIILPLPDPSARANVSREQPEPAFAAAPVESEEPTLLISPVDPFPAADLRGARRDPASYLPLALMLAVGVALLAAATYWFVHAHPTMGAVAPSVIGWVLGLTGVGLLAASIYFLLERIGEPDER